MKNHQFTADFERRSIDFVADSSASAVDHCRHMEGHKEMKTGKLIRILRWYGNDLREVNIKRWES